MNAAVGLRGTCALMTVLAALKWQTAVIPDAAAVT